MIRLYNRTVEKILEGLLVLRSRGITLDDIRNVMRGYEDPNPQVMAALHIMGERFDGDYDPITMDSLITELAVQITDRTTNGDGTLIEALVEVLQLPYIHNSLTPRILRGLRQAILVPQEMAGLVERLHRKEMSCTTCGTPFENGEAVTFRIDEDDEIRFDCHRCQRPEVVACDTEKCPSKVNVRKVFGRTYEGKTVSCDNNHTEAPEDPPIPTPARLRERGDIRPRYAVLPEWAPFGGPPRTAPPPIRFFEEAEDDD